MFTETDGTLVLGVDDEVADPFVGVLDRFVDGAGVEDDGAVLGGVELTVDMP